MLKFNNFLRYISGAIKNLDTLARKKAQWVKAIQRSYLMIQGLFVEFPTPSSSKPRCPPWKNLSKVYKFELSCLCLRSGGRMPALLFCFDIKCYVHQRGEQSKTLQIEQICGKISKASTYVQVHTKQQQKTRHTFLRNVGILL